jgi:SAM-dependent methyltransferase
MLTHEYHTLRKVEDTFWWYNTLRRMVVKEVRRRVHSDEVRLLDAGCGTGGMMERLRQQNQNWQIIGVDVSPEAVQHTRERGFHEVTAGTVSALPFDDTAFNGVLSLDVLYHDEVDDRKALTEFARVLAPGGFLVLNLPAFPFLAGRHDTAVRGARRYTAGEVRGLLRASGFRVDTVYYWNAWLFLPVLAWRFVSRFFRPKNPEQTRSDLHLMPITERLNGTLAVMSRADARLCRTVPMPVGTSVFAVATRV